MLLSFAILCCLCALLPAGLFFANRPLFRPPPRNSGPGEPVSVLIPARNEEAAIAAALESVLASRDLDFEVIVLDDNSEDRTAEMVRSFCQRDARVRLEGAPALPAGWNGKQHACHCLSQLARYDRWLFLDADVRLAPEALARLSPLLAGADLWSGVPRQVTVSFSEKLLLPLIHFVLLGYLPLARMRASGDPALGAGCGQLFLTTRGAYEKTGGHAQIRASLHDGLHLPRSYRKAGLRTDLVDVTGLAHCRMYHSNAATWRGLAKNAHEGMGAPGVLVPMTVLLLLGQVVPFVLLVISAFHRLPGAVVWLAAISCAAGWMVRAAAALRFRQSWLGAILHPLGIVGLLKIQWWSRLRQLAGLRSTWKGRVYGDSSD